MSEIERVETGASSGIRPDIDPGHDEGHHVSLLDLVWGRLGRMAREASARHLAFFVLGTDTDLRRIVRAVWPILQLGLPANWPDLTDKPLVLRHDPLEIANVFDLLIHPTAAPIAARLRAARWAGGRCDSRRDLMLGRARAFHRVRSDSFRGRVTAEAFTCLMEHDDERPAPRPALPSGDP